MPSQVQPAHPSVAKPGSAGARLLRRHSSPSSSAGCRRPRWAASAARDGRQSRRCLSLRACACRPNPLQVGDVGQAMEVGQRADEELVETEHIARSRPDELPDAVDGAKPSLAQMATVVRARASTMLRSGAKGTGASAKSMWYRSNSARLRSPSLKLQRQFASMRILPAGPIVSRTARISSSSRSRSKPTLA